MGMSHEYFIRDIAVAGIPPGRIISSYVTDFLGQFDNVQVQNFGSQFIMDTNVIENFGPAEMGDREVIAWIELGGWR